MTPDEAALLVLLLRDVREKTAGRFQDLRGRATRSVGRDDIVVITGAEYLRKSRAAALAEQNGMV